MFLAAIYPLSERSAVNLMGKVNTSNVTGYEDQTIFESNGATMGTDLKTVTTDWGEDPQDQVLLSLPRSPHTFYPVDGVSRRLCRISTSQKIEN